MQQQSATEGNSRSRRRTTSVESQEDKENVVWESEVGKNRKSTVLNVPTSRLNIRRSNPSFSLARSNDLQPSHFLPFEDVLTSGKQGQDGNADASDGETFNGGDSRMVASNSNSSLSVNATSIGSNSTIDISALPTVPSFEACQTLYPTSEVEVLQDPKPTRWDTRKPALPLIPTSSRITASSSTADSTNALSLRSIWDPEKDEIVPFVPMNRTRSLDDPFAPSPNDPPYVSSKNLKDLENLSGRDQRSSTWNNAASRLGARANDLAGAGGTGSDARDGDWMCNVCGYHNFKKNDQCMKCLSPNPHLSQSPYLSSARPQISRVASEQTSRSYASQYSDTQSSILDQRQQYEIDLETQLLTPFTGNFASLPISTLVPSKGFSNQGQSQLTILAKLAAHIEALCMLGRQGEDLKRILVEGDLGMGLAMGMRGLIGKEAVNPWKVMGVEIPSQQFGKFGPKPALGSVAGDWQCSCGRENWAKRSVCSRCFPGIEPEWKSTVLSYIQPILQLVDGQQQLLDTRRDLQRVNEEEKRLRKEQQQQHSGPTIGRKYVAEARSKKQSSRHQEHLASSEMLRLTALAGGTVYPSLDGKGFFVPTRQAFNDNITSARGPRFNTQPTVYSHPNITHPSDGGPIVESDSEDSFNPFPSSALPQLPATDWIPYTEKQSSAEQAKGYHGESLGANQPFAFPPPVSTAFPTYNERNQIRQPTTQRLGDALNSRNTRSISPIGHRRPRSKASSSASGNNLENNLEEEEDWPDLVSRFHGALGGFDF